MFLGITPVSSVSNGLYFLTLPLVSVMCVIYRSKGMLKKFGVHIIYRKIRYTLKKKSLSKDVHFFPNHMDLKRKIFRNSVIRIFWAKLHSVLAHNVYNTQVTGIQYWKEILYISNRVTLNTNRNKMFTNLVLQVVYWSICLVTPPTHPIQLKNNFAFHIPKIPFYHCGRNRQPDSHLQPLLTAQIIQDVSEGICHTSGECSLG
jgi:hypothetical protein